MLINLFVYVKWIARFLCRRKTVLLLFSLLAAVVLVPIGCWWFADVGSKFLMPPAPPDQDLEHFRRSRSLEHYLDNVQILIEPSSSCTDSELPVVILVTTAPSHFDQRQAIRQTWGRHQSTYFMMGIDGNEIDENLVENYIEAKQYSDLIVYDFRDHYQNLTLKTALMIQWTVKRCSAAKFMFKVDDDVIVNPWTLNTVLKENRNAKLIGYKMNNTRVHRDEYNRWYVPRWLFTEDVVDAYLNGPAYLINGAYLKSILGAAKKVPLINLEDIYFSHLVASRQLEYELTHDSRLCPYKPWGGFACAYRHLASAHSLSPSDVAALGPRLARLSEHSCSFYDKFISTFVFLF